MIQRIQSVYLAILIILVSIATFGMSFFSFVNETSRFTFSSFGITEFDKTSNELISFNQFPIYAGLISLILLAFMTLMSYKNLKRQFKLGRTVFFLYFVMLTSLFIMSIFGYKLLKTDTYTREMGFGFLVFVCGFPFAFLANTGIKRDKKLLESLDRLR